MVNFIKSKTGGKKMTYIGHSQGTTLFFMNVMHDPTFVEKSFESLVTIGTVPNIIHIKFAPIELLDKIYGILKALGIFNSFNLSNSQRKVLAKFCKGSPNICGKIFDILASIKPSWIIKIFIICYIIFQEELVKLIYYIGVKFIK